MQKRSDYFFPLPTELIAQHPGSIRSESRLMLLDRNTGNISHRRFHDLEQHLNPGDLLVFNDTKVLPARLHGHKQGSGGAIEALVERCLSEHVVLCHLRFSKAPAVDSTLCFARGQHTACARVLERRQEFFVLEFHDPEPVEEILYRLGEVPLPPYIRRPPDARDLERYQTVYAKHTGSVAAPTAGLHFDAAMFEGLAAAGVHTTFVTLHIGAGTFQPVRTMELDGHRMHQEWCCVDAEAITAIRRCKSAGNRVIAVGTTSIRALEATARRASFSPWQGEVDLFIRPPHDFRIADGLLTNFHLPESTLLMLVCALAGHESVMVAYTEAVRHRYRFFSYGDAMLILPFADAPSSGLGDHV